MTVAIIDVEKLGKQYNLTRTGAMAPGALRFSEVLAAHLRNPFGLQSATTVDLFWALQDVSFKVAEGEVVGIIGRNGAGKSTLLKILSRITEPSQGRVRLRGRVASLLEVGTGFHPELTGRENIYLNGAILGLQRAEITQRFDEIVDFAGTERFLDTPVKRYSSGMYVRLAFAVAAHLEPEILVVDEVLAVGDAAFQQKCIGKLSSVAHSGRTVLFVSHNIGAVKSLCGTAIWLDEGRIQAQGAAEQVCLDYINSLDLSATGSDIVPSQHLRGDGRVLIHAVGLSNYAGQHAAAFNIHEPFILKFEYTVKESIRGSFWFIISTIDGTHLLSSFQRDSQGNIELERDGTISVNLDPATFLPETYLVSAGILDHTPTMVDWVDNVLCFEILPQFHSGLAYDHRHGLMTQEFQWKQY